MTVWMIVAALSHASVSDQGNAAFKMIVNIHLLYCLVSRLVVRPRRPVMVMKVVFPS
jgi:hypothetical protein